ncbi:hypothetical protein KR009_003168 [Drosophila setifemur]|nr:hypothetical protein KR009_003168 [Drosophila setifemur]
MNFCSVPYEADYGMYADSKMKSVPQFPMTMNPGQGQAMSMQPLNPPQMNLQMPMQAMGAPQMTSFPLQSMPLGMMPSANGMTPLSMSTSNLPIGAVTPLSSMTMMPMNSMGSIDAPGVNAVIPDLQSMSSLGHMQALQQFNQQSPSSTQMHQGRLTGGDAGMPSCPSSPSQSGNWSSSGMPNSSQMMANAGMWQFAQPSQSQYPQQQQPQYQHQYQQHHQQQQLHHHQQQASQQGHRMKNPYDMANNTINYRELRNGLK